jgi:hypothetical protein
MGYQIYVDAQVGVCMRIHYHYINDDNQYDLSVSQREDSQYRVL